MTKKRLNNVLLTKDTKSKKWKSTLKEILDKITKFERITKDDLIITEIE